MTKRASSPASYNLSITLRNQELHCSFSGVRYSMLGLRPAPCRRLLASMSSSSSCFLRKQTTSTPLFFKALTWSLINERRGLMTMVTPLVTPLVHTAGSWKQRLFPPPVGISTKTSRPARVALIASSWCFRNELSPNTDLSLLMISG